MIEHDYQIAVDSIGQPYLDAEQRLLAQGDTAISLLNNKVDEVDSQTRQIIEVILEWLAGNETYAAVMDYFEQVEKRAASTAMLIPPAEGVANYLIQNFGESVADLLGVYLIKLETILPTWQTSAILIYLGELSGEAAAGYLIQFITSTSNDAYRELAVSSLVSIGDESVLDQIDDQLNDLNVPVQALQQAADQIRNTSES